MIKILYVIPALNEGGVETIVYNYISNLNTDKYSVDIACYSFYHGIYRTKFEDLGCRIFEIPSKKRLLKSYSTLSAILKKNKYDIVHVHKDEKSLLPITCAWLNKVPVRIVHIHNANHGGIFTIINRKLSKLIFYKIANGFFACGMQAAKDFYGVKFNDKNIFIMRNSIDSNKFKYCEKNRKEIRKQYGFLDNDIIIGCVARLSAEKNHIFLIGIMKELKKINNNYKIICWGEGEVKGYISKKIHDNKLENDIIIAGARNDIDKCYSGIDMLIMTSLYEGMPLTPLEALSNGLDVILSDTITKEIELSNKVHFLKLGDGEKEWAKYIAKIIPSRCESVNIGFYDLKESVLLLDKEYDRLLNIFKRK